MSGGMTIFGDLVKPADTLIKKIADAIEGGYRPYQTRRVERAKAEAKAESRLIEAQSDIRVSDLQLRALRRRIREEELHQKNMENITAKAILDVEEDANPDSMENDWIVNFFDKARIISNNEMQDLWARILAGEANTPGSYSKRTVNFMSDVNKNDGELFSALCRYTWTFYNENFPLIFSLDNEIYNRHGIRFGSLTHLESIGLIQLDRAMIGNGFAVTPTSKERQNPDFFRYYDSTFRVHIPDSRKDISVGKVLLTTIGRELASICMTEPVEGFIEYVSEQWKEFEIVSM